MGKYRTSLLIFTIIITSSVNSQNVTLWGMTYQGGDSIRGTLFSYNASTGTYKVRHSFGATDSDGIHPYGSLLLAQNGLLYGTTSAGGRRGGGILFSFDRATNTLTDIHDFTGLGNDGAWPWTAPMQATDSLLYGVTLFGGQNNYGMIYTYNTATDTFIDVHDFTGVGDGKEPRAALLQINDSLFYGNCGEGGQNGNGTVFCFNKATDSITFLHSCGNSNDLKSPYSSFMRAKNGRLYSMSPDGGLGFNDAGTIYSVSPDSNKINIDFSLTNASGYYPDFGTPIPIGDSLLYGLTGFSQTGRGEIFSYNIYTGHQTPLNNFNTQNGAGPLASLMLASDSLLYGMTAHGGASDSGTIFSYNIATNTITNVYDFMGQNGSVPWGNLIEAIDTFTIIPTSVIDLTADNLQLSVFPNPSNGKFTIRVSGQQRNYAAQIFDLLGQKVSEIQLTNGYNTVDLQNLSPSTYFISILSLQTTEKYKLAIVK